MAKYINIDMFKLGDKSVGASRAGEKRPIQDAEALKSKRQKVDEESAASDSNTQMDKKHTDVVACEREDDYANHMHTSLLCLIEYLRSPDVNPDSPRPDVALTALSTLCIAFCRYPETNMALTIFQQMYSWIPWILEQVFWALKCVFMLICLSIPLIFKCMCSCDAGKASKSNQTCVFNLFGRNSQHVAFAK